MKKIKIADHKPGMELEILNLFERVYHSIKLIEHWQWQFYNNPGKNNWITLGYMNNTLIGQYSSIKYDLSMLGEKIQGAQAVDAMVSNECQRRGVFKELGLKTHKKMKDDRILAVWGFPNNNSYPGHIKYFNWRKILYLKKYSKRIGYKKINFFVDKLSKILIYHENKIRIKIRESLYGKNYKYRIAFNIPAEIDTLLEFNRIFDVLCIWKDIEYLKWRYENNPTHKYLYHTIWKNDDLLGFIITNMIKNTVNICEIFVSKSQMHIGELLLRYCVKYYIKTQVQKIIFFGHDDGFYDYVFKSSDFKINEVSDFLFGGTVFGNNKLRKVFYFPNNWNISYGDTDIV
jgi:hypothetical protein